MVMKKSEDLFQTVHSDFSTFLLEQNPKETFPALKGTLFAFWPRRVRYTSGGTPGLYWRNPS